MLAGIGNLLHAGEHLRPDEHAQGVVAVLRVQFADGCHIELVGFLLVAVHVDDGLLERLGFLEVAEILHRMIERFAALIDELGELERTVVHEVDVVHVEALEHIFDVVDDIVEVLGERDDVFTLDRRDEVGGDCRVHVVADLVALMLDVLSARHDVLDGLRRREVLDGFDKEFRLLHRKRRLALERFEVVEFLVLLLAHYLLLTQS